MSRCTFRFALAVLAVAGGLALAAPKAEAAGKSAGEEVDVWSRALRWATHLWEESVVSVWETQGWMIDPNGSQVPVPPEGTNG